MPLDRLALREKLGLSIHQPTEPLSCGEELEGSISLLEELDGMHDGFGLFLERRAIPRRAGIGLSKHFDDVCPSPLDRLAFEFRVSGIGLRDVETFIGRLCEIQGAKPSVGPDDLAKRQVFFTPPLDVGLIAERTDHQHAGPLVGVRHFARKDRYRRMEEWRDGSLAEEGLIAFIVGMGRDTDARGE